MNQAITPSIADFYKESYYNSRAIGGKWKMQIIASIKDGNDLFSTFRQSIPGISPKILIKELKDLEVHQLITRILKQKGMFTIVISYGPEHTGLPQYFTQV